MTITWTPWERFKKRRRERQEWIMRRACHYLKTGHYTIEIALYSARCDLQRLDETPDREAILAKYEKDKP